jgi:hypothetical protein
VNKLLLPILAAIAIGSGVMAFTKFQSHSALQAELARISAELAAQNDALRALRADSDQAIALLKEDNERLKRERDQAKEKAKELVADAGAAGSKGADSSKDGANPKQFDVRGMMQGFAKRMDDPETRKMMKQGQERMISGAYDSVFKKLGLSDQETKLVTELLADRNFAALDKGRKILTGAGADDAAMATARQDIAATKAEFDGKLKAVLGEQKFTELSSYEQTVGDQRALESFERNFRGKNQQLESTQKTALTDIMRQERLKSPSDEIPDLGGGPGTAVLLSEPELKAREQQEQAYQERVIARASEAGLNPDQVTILQDSFKQRTEWRSFGTRMSRAFIKPN